MFKTANEGFYSNKDSPRHQNRNKSKKRGNKRSKKRGNALTVHPSIGQSGAGQALTPGTHTYQAASNTHRHLAIPEDLSSQYGKMNMTVLKTPIPTDGLNTTKTSESTMHNMKQAMKRKIQLPNAMPRRQDVIYDLNGRPLYKGGYLRAIEASMTGTASKSNSPNSKSQSIGAHAHTEIGEVEIKDYDTNSKWNPQKGHNLIYTNDGANNDLEGQARNQPLWAKAPN